MASYFCPLRSTVVRGWDTLGGSTTLYHMPQPRQHPTAYLEKDGNFPDGPFRPEAPPEVYLAAALANRLKAATRGESIRYIAKLSDLSPQTILNIQNGTSWPDLRTIARLETVFDYRLWGYEHRNPPHYFYYHRGFVDHSYPKKPRDYRTVLTR